MKNEPFAPLKPKPEKLCPITFHLDPVTSLQRNFAAAIEKTNADLAKMLAEFRLAVLGSRGVKTTYSEKKWIVACQDRFAGSYLKNPVLWGDDGKTYTGWGEITCYLGAIMPSTTYLAPQSAHVYLEYLPIKSAKYAEWNQKSKDGEEIDFLAFIRTVLAFAPYDDPMEIGNEAPIPHRKICDPIF